MKELTSAAANKMIKALDEEKTYLLTMEDTSSVYVMAEGEKAEIPVYDYNKTQQRIDEIDGKIRILKHAINYFDVTTKLSELDITIDEAFGEMAQLNRKKFKLDNMRKRLPKARKNEGIYRNNSMIEYTYINYDIEAVQRDYQEVSDRIIKLQMALDLCNQTMTFSVDV